MLILLLMQSKSNTVLSSCFNTTKLRIRQQSISRRMQQVSGMLVRLAVHNMQHCFTVEQQLHNSDNTDEQPASDSDL